MDEDFFAGRLRELRGRAGLSQAALAGKAGIGPSTIRQFEYGMREPTYGTLVKLADGLGVSLAMFHPASALPGAAKPAKPKRPRVHARKEK